MAVWQPIDFHGIVTLSKSVVKDLREYLDLKENQLGHQILHVVLPSKEDSLPPIILPTLSGNITLGHSVDIFGKRVQSLDEAGKQLSVENDWNEIVLLLNKSCWCYIELLEGMAIELFQQLDQIGVELWGRELIGVVDDTKALLQKKIKEAIHSFNTLEKHLKTFRLISERNVGLKAKVKRLFHHRLLDKNLFRNLEKTNKFIGFRYQIFMHRFEQFEMLLQSTDSSTKKFENYQVLGCFEERQKLNFVRLYQWIRIWELNQTTKSLPEREFVRAIRALLAPEKFFHFFKEYEKALWESLFNGSRSIKVKPYIYTDLVSRIQYQHMLQGCIAEVHTLGVIVRKFRDFLLKTDPNPYIRSRLGFGERIVGLEPAISKDLMNLVFDIETLDSLFKKLMASSEKREDTSFADLEKAKSNIEQLLHEMAQPLASYSLMSLKGKAFVQQLELVNELGSTCAGSVVFVGNVLSRALRNDWKFHVFHEIADFQQILKIHQGIVGSVLENHHLNRMRHFKKLINRIEEWVKNDDTFRHLGEIEAEISDLKGYLQDFLAHVQRIARNGEADQVVDVQQLNAISNQLLEYRFLFGRFFHELRREKGEERLVRNQFLFVDQYFESVENKLFELRSIAAY